MRVYIIGSLRNERIPTIANAIQDAGHEAFSDWYSPGPQADEFWHAYETHRGRSYFEAINGPHAWHCFEFDKKWLDWSDGAVLVLPAGKSAHIELGYMTGQHKPVFVLMDGEPERFDIMYRFASGIYGDLNSLIEGMR